jgi:5-oxoprolinase (ATP-hydrolysing)
LRRLEDLNVVGLELFTNRFRSLVDDMGEMLRRTAVSVNVKERLDYSCALLDADGRLVVNAPHIPVHLGSLGLCVREVSATLELGPGDVALTNHPAFGGSHLPDITVITPVFGQSTSSNSLLGYVANRAHHAEIGGKKPGSMPPDARSLAEEGVVIAPRYLVRRGEPRWSEVRKILASGPFPSRAVEENLADLAAAIAANQRGSEALRKLAETHGADEVGLYMEALSRQAHSAVAESLARFDRGTYTAVERLDDGSPLRVRIELGSQGAFVDLSGSAPVHPGNLNATPGVVRSALLYVLRLLIERPLPLNEGLLEKVELHVPRGILNPSFGDDPESAPAVVGGNVETSQRLVDTLLKAFEIVACSQGTMNNVVFGDERFGYYETVCGGAGAGPGFFGADAVHTHMTNTAITDPEILENRYPVRLERFAVRHGSGGRGQYRGGDGVERVLLFEQALSLSVLTQHRVESPYGLAGGEPGQRGSQYVLRRSGERLDLRSVDGCEVEPGDRLVLLTPGGGGFGSPTGPSRRQGR